MKKILLLLMFISSLASCTSVKYTHEQVMDRYTTKSDIAEKFGVPTQKRYEGNIEQWYYDLGQVTRSGSYRTNGNSNSTVNVVGNTATINTTYTPATVTNWTRTYNRYIIVMFDERGNVVNWKTKGVNYQVRVKSPVKTLLLLGGAAAAGGVLISTSTTKEGDLY